MNKIKYPLFRGFHLDDFAILPQMKNLIFATVMCIAVSTPGADCSCPTYRGSAVNIVGREAKGAQSFNPKLGTSEPLGETQHGVKWLPNGRKPKVLFLCLHGIQTFAEWYGPLGREMASLGHGLYAIDRRGSGSWSVVPGKPWHQAQRGQIANWQDWIEDIKSAAKAIRTEHPGVPLFLVGTSWGAKTALGTLEENTCLFTGGILLVPAFHTRIDPNPLVRNVFIPLSAYAAGEKMVNLRNKLPPSKYSGDCRTWQQWLGTNAGSAANPLLENVTRKFIQESNKQFGIAAHRDAVRQIKVPLLAVFGAADELVKVHASDHVLKPLREDPPGVSRTDGHPKLTTLIMAGGTHAMMVEQEQFLAKTLVDWALKVSGSVAPTHGELWMPAYACGLGVDEKGRSLAKRASMKGNKILGVATGVKVTAGESITVDTDERWQLFDLSTGPVGHSGIPRCQEVLPHKWARKSLILPDQPYFSLVALVRNAGGNVFKQPVLFEPGRTTATLVPVATGTLSFILNDALFAPGMVWTNNHGTLHLKIGPVRN